MLVNSLHENFKKYFYSDFQIKKLREEKIIIESKYAVFRKSTGVDDLIAQVKTLKSELNDINHKLNRANVENDIYKRKIDELEIKSAIAQQKPSTVDAHVQTDCTKSGATFVEQMDWERVNRRAENYKKHYQEAATAHNELKGKYEKLKTKLGTSHDDSTFNELKTKYEDLQSQYQEVLAQNQETSKTMEELQWKYTETKRICNARFDEIKKYKEQLEMNLTKAEMQVSGEAAYNQLNVKYEELKSKYDATLKKCTETAELLDEIKEKYRLMKQICEKRFKEIEDFKVKIDELKKNDATLRAEIETLNQQLVQAKGDLETSGRKYARAKEILADQKEKIDLLKDKYGQAKDLLESRRLEILRLSAIVEGETVNIENMPRNK